MNKSIFVLALLFTIPAVASESFSFLSGDMIDHNFATPDHIPSNNESEIINFYDSSNEQQLKRYLIFGKGSSSELGNITTDYSVSSSNGFFSIVIIPENTISIFQKIMLVRFPLLEILQIQNVYILFIMLQEKMLKLLLLIQVLIFQTRIYNIHLHVTMRTFQ